MKMYKFFFSNDGFTYLMHDGEVVAKTMTVSFMKNMNGGCVRSLKDEENHMIEFEEYVEKVA